MQWRIAVLAAVCVCWGAGAAPAPGLVVCHFDTEDLRAAVNSYGGAAAAGERIHGGGGGGSGCPAAPGGRALDAGYELAGGAVHLPGGWRGCWGQGTLEFWLQPNWDFGTRAIRNLVGHAAGGRALELDRASATTV